ncbi:MAG: ABC transporter substrate-binding protein [Clostridiales bacterium]|nr:ABC transporter substrate-binding protein [Clostridiales bacterium]
MYDDFNYLGTLLYREEQAAVLQGEYEDYMSSYYQDKTDGPSVLLLMCFPDGFYLVASEDSYVGDLVSLAGGQNVYADYEGTQEGFISINPEDMVQKEPDMILVFAHYNEEAAFAYMENEFATNAAWSYYDAVNEGNIVYLPSEYFGMSASLDWTDALEYLEPYLYED